MLSKATRPVIPSGKTFKQIPSAENTHLYRKGKYHSMADFLSYWFGLNQTSKSVDNFYLTK